MHEDRLNLGPFHTSNRSKGPNIMEDWKTIVLTPDESVALATFLGGGELTERERTMFVGGWECAVNNEEIDLEPDGRNEWGRAILAAAKVSLEAFLTVPAARPGFTTYDEHLCESRWLGNHDAKTDREYVASVAGYYAGSSGFRLND
jgi:hypothetical protein